MDAASIIRSAPRVIELGGNAAAPVELDEELVSVRGELPDKTVATFEDGEISVAPVSSAPDPSGERRIGPVYRQPGGGLAVPTGRVLVRFAPDDSPQAHSEELGEAGFKVEEVLGYAPHAAWVRPHDEQPVAALSELAKLRSLPGVEHVEPQVLTEMTRRAT
ncbi:MAG TPA: hypothetical protein VFI03_08595 [Solirubrobacterales bacterium]|nr:hypothetical protein [Solirubrobacterales bacterium]